MSKPYRGKIPPVAHHYTYKVVNMNGRQASNISLRTLMSMPEEDFERLESLGAQICRTHQTETRVRRNFSPLQFYKHRHFL